MNAVRRVAALARAEAVLLRRTPTALAGALVAPLTLALAPFSSPREPGSEGELGSNLVIGLAAFSLILAVYYNLVTALVARREEFVLKRLRTGELSDLEIIAGAAAPAVAIAWAQIAVGAAIAHLFLDLSRPGNPALVLGGVIAGTALCILLAAAVTTVTGSVETAQLTATPLLVLSLSFSGALFPLDTLSDRLEPVARALPLSPVVELLRLGLTGTGSWGTPVLILGAWFAAGAWVVRRRFRWEPRR